MLPLHCKNVKSKRVWEMSNGDYKFAQKILCFEKFKTLEVLLGRERKAIQQN